MPCHWACAHTHTHRESLISSLTNEVCSFGRWSCRLFFVAVTIFVDPGLLDRIPDNLHITSSLWTPLITTWKSSTSSTKLSAVYKGAKVRGNRERGWSRSQQERTPVQPPSFFLILHMFSIDQQYPPLTMRYHKVQSEVERHGYIVPQASSCCIMCWTLAKCAMTGSWDSTWQMNPDMTASWPV